MKKKIVFRNYVIEITLREVIFSLVIIFLMLGIGFLLSEKITSSVDNQNDVYYSALKINNDADMFEYGMRTNIGNAFVYGDFKAVDPINSPETNGLWTYLEKETQKYTEHTRVVSHTRTVNGKTETYYTTETYWEWDTIDTDRQHASQIEFCGIAFDYSKFGLSGNSHYICTNSLGYHLRAKYYGIDAESQGTIFTKLSDNTISDGSDYSINMNIDETLKSYLASGTLLKVIFWIVWIILTSAVVYGFCYLQNDWLEDR